MTKEEIAKAFLCVDCGIDTNGENEYYSVYDHIWDKYVTGSHNKSMLCIGCLEARMGRKLTKSDFTDYPINSIFPQSERLKDRLNGRF